MTRVFPSPAGTRRVRFPHGRERGRVALAAACALSLSACDQNMSDTPLPASSPEDLSRISSRLAGPSGAGNTAGSTGSSAASRIEGVIGLAPGIDSLTAPTDVVFVIAREPGNEGAPLAVERLSGNAYPMRFRIDASVSILAGGEASPADAPRTGPVQLIVKVDKDGDAGTSSAEDLLGFTPEPVLPGQEGVEILVEASLGQIAASMGAAPPPGEGRAARVAPGAPATTSAAGAIRGSIELPGVLASRTSPSDVVFVVARRPGAQGPPVAVARLTGNRYPMSFTLDESSLMLGGSWPDSVEIDVRVDRDGDPLTRDSSALASRPRRAVRPGGPPLTIELAGTP
ncbi:MAG: hypothetical protein H0V09_01495 [Gemmatimonadetes bacterium]|nr:hypothetical protein [Gemmatimonadota bacterium]